MLHSAHQFYLPLLIIFIYCAISPKSLSVYLFILYPTYSTESGRHLESGAEGTIPHILQTMWDAGQPMFLDWGRKVESIQKAEIEPPTLNLTLTSNSNVSPT